MSEPEGAARTSRLPGRVLLPLSATLLTIISAMFHGSHAAARLEGPRGWTGWVLLDLALIAAPIILPAATYAVRRMAGHDGGQNFLDLCLGMWLATAFLSCVLAAFWV